MGLPRGSPAPYASTLLAALSFDDLHQADVVVLGSDEIWNFRNGLFGVGEPTGRPDWPFAPYFGGGFAAGMPIISYAPSFNQLQSSTLPRVAAASDLFNVTALALHHLLGRLDAVSVRDEGSASLASELLNRKQKDKPAVVLDPTYLLYPRWLQPGFEAAFRSLLATSNVHAFNRSAPLTYPQEGTHVSPTVGTPRTMVRYGYGMQQSPKQDLAGWTVSDASQDDPWSFVSAVRGAERVLTNTFHGLTFSILLHKDFAVPAVMRDGNLRPSGSSTSKVWDLLRAYNLTDRLMDPRTGAWPHRPVHWRRLDHALRKDIRHSLRWLHSAVERVGKKGHAKDSYVTVRR